MRYDLVNRVKKVTGSRYYPKTGSAESQFRRKVHSQLIRGAKKYGHIKRDQAGIYRGKTGVWRGGFKPIH